MVTVIQPNLTGHQAIGHKAKDCKLETNQNGGQNSGNHKNFQKNTSNCTYCTYCHQPGHIKSNWGASNNDGQGHIIFNSNNVAFTTIAMKFFSSDMLILGSGASCH
jgi:hypothetical protein